MITRTAIFEGRVKVGREDDFFSGVERKLVPLWLVFPHALAVRWFRVEGSDDPARPVVMIQQIDYPSLEEMEKAVTSPEREAGRAVTLELMELFDGRLYHVITGSDRLCPGA
jgi:hypothetical protein